MRKIAVLVFGFFLVTGILRAEPWRPDNERILEAGKALERAQKFDSALQLYWTYLKDDSSEEHFRRTATLIGKRRNYEGALKVLDRGLKKFPQSVPLLNLKALALQRFGKRTEAENEWKKVLALEPGNPAALQGLNRSLPQVGSNGAVQSQTPAKTPAGGSNLAPAGPPLPLPEQEALASKVFKELTETDQWDLDSFISGYQKVMTKCPDTQQAEMACWRLSNLYLLAGNDPNYDGVIETLEHFIKKYPGNVLYGEAKERLLLSYKATENWKKVAEMLEELFRLNPQPADEDLMKWSLSYGEALAGLGKTEQAKKYFDDVLKLDKNQDSIEARVSRAKLAGLK